MSVVYSECMEGSSEISDILISISVSKNETDK